MFTLKSEKDAWVNELDRRLEQLRAGRIAARLRVSEECFWWYIQEFGSASHAERGSTGTAPRDADGFYEIVPVHQPEMVWGGDERELTRSKHVWHPGVVPKHFVTTAIDEIKQEFKMQIAPLIMTGQVNLAREVLISEVMAKARDLIVTNIAQQLQGSSEWGRLGGQTAANNFEENAELIDTSG